MSFEVIATKLMRYAVPCMLGFMLNAKQLLALGLLHFG